MNIDDYGGPGGRSSGEEEQVYADSNITYKMTYYTLLQCM